MKEGGDPKDVERRDLWSRALTRPDRHIERSLERDTRAAPDRQTRKSTRQGGRK